MQYPARAQIENEGGFPDGGAMDPAEEENSVTNRAVDLIVRETVLLVRAPVLSMPECLRPLTYRLSLKVNERRKEDNLLGSVSVFFFSLPNPKPLTSKVLFLGQFCRGYTPSFFLPMLMCFTDRLPT